MAKAKKATRDEVLALLGLEKNGSTSGYASKMTSLLNFLQATEDIRTGAEITKQVVIIDDCGVVVDKKIKDGQYYAGVIFEVVLQTGRYSFPIPEKTKFYDEVCNILGLEVSTKVVEKPVMKRMFNMPAAAIAAIKKAAKFTSNDDLRPSMQCVCIQIKDEKMVICGTDAHRLYVSQKFEVVGPPGEYEYLIPSWEIKKIKDSKQAFFFYEMKDESLAIGNVPMKRLDAKFPDWRVVVPKYKKHMKFDKELFLENVAKVYPYSNKSTRQVDFHINGTIKMHSQDVDFSFEGNAEMPYIKKYIPDTTIAFSGKLLMECLSIFKEKEIKMLTDGEKNKCALFTNDVDTVLLMPLMMNS